MSSPRPGPNLIEGESAEDREKRLLAEAGQFPLVAAWCDHEDPECELRCFKQDGECECGMRKHHYHGVCGGVIQIG